MTSTAPPTPADGPATAPQLFDEHRLAVWRQTDRLFAYLMCFQWLAGILAACLISPRTWSGSTSGTHPHVWTAVVLGGLTNLFPAALAILRPGATSTRLVVSTGQALTSALLIHLTGGRIETHFHVFGSLAFLSFYRDWRALVPATVVTAADHFLRGVYFPLSVYGELAVAQWRWLEHAGWVVFEDICLVAACLRGTREMWQIAERTAESARRNAELAATRDTALDCIITMDHRGAITEFNSAAERTFGYARDRVIGRPLAGVIVPPALRAPHGDGLDVYLGTGAERAIGRRIEAPAVRADGSEFPAEIAITGVRVDGHPIFVVYLRDITERTRAAEALGQAVGEAERARAAAEAASKAKSQFLANMSHEIRTPLNGVIGMADILIRRGELGERQARYARVIKSSADSLLALINDILDFSKIEAGKLELSRVDFDLRDAVEGVTEMLAARAAAKGLEFACHVQPDVPSRVHGDPDRLRQVLINLASNAIKFTETGEVVIRVAAGTAATDGADRLRFCVSDTGVGVPPDQVDRLFKSFSQVDGSATRKYGGTGLGLAIAKQLTELMGGTIGVETVAGRGSTFWFTARLARAAAAAARFPRGADEAPDAQFRGVRVLVIDDHAACRDVLRDQLAAWGFDVAVAGDGEEALRATTGAAAEGRPFRIALVDLIMPRMDGFAFAEAVKGDPRLAGTALLMLTSMDRPMGPADRAAAGFVALLTKPVRQSQLFDAVAEAIATTGDRSALLGREVGDAPDAGPAAPPVSVIRAGTRVLLAEDNEINQEVARELLVGAGCDVRVVGNGALAVSAALDGAFDVLLMDCQMPVMDGFEAARRIRELEAARAAGGVGARLPIIALTANAVEGDRQRCLDAGMDDYVTKPIDADVLLETVRALTDRARETGPAPKAEQPSRPPAADVEPAVPPVATATPGRPAAGDDPFDVTSLLRRCQGKASLAERLLGKFEQQLPDQLAQLRGSLDARDREALARLAHTIKGTAANLSAEPVRRAAGEVERLGAAADWANGSDVRALDDCLSRLADAARACVAALPATIASVQKSGTAPRPGATVRKEG